MNIRIKISWEEEKDEVGGQKILSSLMKSNFHF